MKEIVREDAFDQCSLPAMPPLKHQDAVLQELFTQRRSSALILWIVALPIYVLACAFMRTFFESSLPFQSSMEQVRRSLGQLTTIAIFCILPFIGLASVLASSVRMRIDATTGHSFISVHVSKLNAALALLALSIAVYAILLLG